MAETLTVEFDGINLDDDSDLDDESYEDVEESFEPVTDMDLLTSIEAARTAMVSFINDQPQKAENIITPLWKSNVYHAVGTAALALGSGFMSFQKDDMEAAFEKVKECAVVINRKRHKDTLTNNMVTKMVVRPNYNTYTEEEVHAELCYAETLVFRALLLFFQDGNLFSYVKGGLKIRKAYQVYKECQEILDHRTNWSHEKLRLEFESGAEMGLGTFNLIVCSLPPRLAKFLQFFGFTGDKDFALKKLKSGHKKSSETIRGFLCTGALFAYNGLARYLLGYPNLSEAMLENLESLRDQLLKECHLGVGGYLAKGRLEVLKGNFPDAISAYQNVLKANVSLGSLKQIPILELAFLHLIREQWRDALKYINILCRDCPWSKALFYYMKGLALYMCDDRTESEYEEMIESFKAVPTSVRRYLGRSFPVDKYMMRKSERFLAQDEWLPLPVCELLYCINYLQFLKGRNEYLEPMMVQIDRTILNLQEGEHKDSPWHVDNYCLAVFLKGLCLAYMGYPLSAEEYFMEVVQNESNVVRDRHYVSFALMELGFISKDTGNFEQALEYFRAARSASIFVTEFRIHQGVQELHRKGVTEYPENEPESFYYK